MLPSSFYRGVSTMNTPDSNFSDFEHSSVEDFELEELLRSTHETPRMPRAVRKRVRRDVTAEWGLSDRQVRRRLKKAARGQNRENHPTNQASRRRISVLPIVASLACVIAVAFLLTANAKSYAWENVLTALREHGVLKANGEHGDEWLDMNGGVSLVRTEQVVYLYDAQANEVLARGRDARSIQRTKLTRTPSASQDEMLVGFLLRQCADEPKPTNLEGVKVASQNWARANRFGREVVDLNVDFTCEPAEEFSIRLTVDPDSHLPLGCNLVGRQQQQPDRMIFFFDDTEAGELKEWEFPSTLPVTESQPVNNVSLASIQHTIPLPAGPADATSKTQVASVDIRTKTDTPQDPGVGLDAEPDRQTWAMGATSTWEPVVVTENSSKDTVAEVNKVLDSLWKENGVEPVAAAHEAELLRRAYLDLAGRTPSVNEVRAYLNDSSPDRYEQLVDRLLNSPDHASHLATVWRTFLIPEGVDLTNFGGIQAFDRWLSDQFMSGDSYDQIVRRLILAEGRLSRSGPLLFYSATKLEPEQLAARTSRVFLGMRLECAQCHDHPFEPWTQQDFWGFAAFFAQISRPRAELETVSTVMQVRDVDHGEVTIPYLDEVVGPKFLDNADLGEVEAGQRRQKLAEWLTGYQNPYFARATANRVWGIMFGKGIVDPIDDFGTQNKPVSPELLDTLAAQLIASDFNMKQLFRTVALSRAYRLSSGSEVVNEDRLKLFAQMPVKTLTAEQVYDCITVATMLDTGANGNPYDFSVARFGNTQREQFLRQFRTPVGQRTEYLGGIPQALTLMNGSLMDGATRLSSSGLLKSLEAPFFTNEQRIEILYFATLSRKPTPAELEVLKANIPDDASGQQLREGLSDLLWVLLNSAEFTMNH